MDPQGGEESSPYVVKATTTLSAPSLSSSFLPSSISVNMRIHMPKQGGSDLPCSPIKAAAESAQSADQLIQCYITSESPRAFELVISEVVVRQLFNRFSEISQRGYTITYCTFTSVLLLVPMPTAVHDIITDFFYHQMADWVDEGFLTREIRKQIRFMPPSTRLPSRRSRKNLSWKKEPDCSLGFGNLGHESISRLVVEVGFSQPKEDLVEDAVEWLRRERRLMVVILVDINEDKRGLTRTQQSNGFHSRVQTLINRYGNSLTREGHDSDGDSDSGQTLYDNIDRAIVEGDWVGPLTATLEVWSRNNEGIPTCREAVVRLLPSCSVEPLC